MRERTHHTRTYRSSIGGPSRRFRLLATGLVATGLVACAPIPSTNQPSPVEPTPTPSAAVGEPLTDDAAFAAAEATYRAYVDALNGVDLAHPATFDPVYALLSGEAEQAAREEFGQMHTDGWVVHGVTKLAASRVHPRSTKDNVRLEVCTDVNDVTLYDASGRSKVSPDRRAVQAMTIYLEWRRARWSITFVDGRTDGLACD